ncbi:MAG: phospho-N-acetylmuramoyl-pentapeptide-transferase [Bacteroidales bacterium]|nr:phospho-N-acetylmuramoyl-pentapeptide-transferase [Bacteroidales bacterium]
MLYYLFNYLQKCNFPGAGVFNYVTFRAAMAVILALIVSVWFGSYFINLLKRKKVVESQRDASIDPYNTKKVGVPTMGGVIIITAILVPVLLVGKLHSVYTLLMIATTLILGILGFADDYIKTFKKKKDGLKPKVKLGGQILLGLIVGLTLRFSPAVHINETVQVKIEDNKEIVVKSPDVKSTRTTIPFLKNHNLNYADLFKWAGPKWMYYLAWIFFVLLTVFVVAAVSNGSNLNDGMDGMASGNSAIIGIALVALAYISSNAVTASHFNLMFIPGSEELVVFLAAFVGALIGFLWFNSFPAQIFMGDTGSLTIGGIIAVSAIIMHKELLLPLLCGVFLFEILSDLDVKLFLKRGKKHRIWKKGPLHDHFRTSYSDFKKVWPNTTVTFKGQGEGYNTVHHEVKITIRFWIVTILLAAFTLITFKIR